MKNRLNSGFIAIAIALLSACGGGGEDVLLDIAGAAANSGTNSGSDVADKYLGNWQSNCFAAKSSNGNTYFYTYRVNTFKASAAVIINEHYDAFAHTDSGCLVRLGPVTPPKDTQISIGSQVTFLGATSDYIVLTIISTGEARPGYMTVNGSQIYFSTFDVNGNAPTQWGSSSPYTRL